MSTSSRRLQLFALLGLILLLAAHTGLSVWARQAVQTELSRLTERYGDLDAATLVAPQVPAEDNRARIIRAAAALTIPPGNELRTSLSQFVNQNESFPVPADIRESAASNRRAVLQAAEALTRRQSDWEADYPNGAGFPPLLELRHLSFAIYVEAHLEIEAGQTDAAAKTISSGLVLASSLRQEPALIAQLIRVAVALPHYEAVEQLITRLEPSKETLEGIALRLAEDRDADPMRLAFLAELKFGNAGMAAMVSGGARNVGNASADAPSWYRVLPRLVTRPILRLAHARYLRRMGELIEIQRGPRPRPPFADVQRPPFWDLPGRIQGIFGAGFERSIETGDLFNSALGVTELGVALRRHRLDHGTYPADLSTLAPAYLAKVPIDPFTGRPPIYTRTVTGFTLKASGGTSPWLKKSSLEWKVER